MIINSGRCFLWDGSDDFNLIYPEFETNLIRKEPLNNIKREGVFEENVRFLSNVEKKDHYNKILMLLIVAVIIVYQ